MIRQFFVVAVVVGVAGCGGGKTQGETSPGSFTSPYGLIDFYEQPFSFDEVKILCSRSSDGLRITISDPHGESQVTSLQPADGSPTADVEVTSSHHDPSTLIANAVWTNINGMWGFSQPDDDVDSHKTFNLRESRVFCPAGH